MKIGIIGLDTSHCIAFTQILNDTSAPDHVPGAKVAAAAKTFSPDVAWSAGRVEEYTKTIRDTFGVRIMPTIEELCREVDCVMIESLDGRAHLEQARPVIAARKRLFIDKPLAGTLRDAMEIFRLAEEAGMPIFTSSAYRFYPGMIELKKAPVGEIRSAISYGPMHLEPHHPDLYFYGIHPTEALYTVLGRGCESVVRTSTPDTDTVVGTWGGGCTGILHGIRTQPLPHKVTVFGTENFAEQKAELLNYAVLVREIVKFFQTGVSPVPAEETLEMFAFMEAADESKRRGGQSVKLKEVIAAAATPVRR